MESELSTEVNPITTFVDQQSFGDWWREFRCPIISEACEGNPRRIPPEADYYFVCIVVHGYAMMTIAMFQWVSIEGDDPLL